jgi:hypothetical protein
MMLAISERSKMEGGGVALLQRRRLGYIFFDSLDKLEPKMMGKVNRMKLFYDAYVFGKHIHSTYKNIGLKSFELFALIRFDVWGSYLITFVNGFKWFVTFINYYS